MVAPGAPGGGEGTTAEGFVGERRIEGGECVAECRTCLPVLGCSAFDGFEDVVDEAPEVGVERAALSDPQPAVERVEPGALVVSLRLRR